MTVSVLGSCENIWRCWPFELRMKNLKLKLI